MGPVNGDGKLSNPQALINSGVIAPTVTLTYIPMTDVKRNHATVADQGMGELVLLLIKTIQPLQ